jgi:hypothetical protein
MKQVEEEYYKADEKIGQAPNAQNGATQQNNQEALFPPSIDQALNTMANNIPDPVTQALNSIIKSQLTIKDPMKKEQNVTVIPESPPLTPIVVVDKMDGFKGDENNSKI